MDTIQEIKKILGDAFVANPTIAAMYGLGTGASFEDEFSAVSLENLLFENIAVQQFAVLGLVNDVKSEVSAMIAAQKKYREPWYVEMSKLFQFGSSLVDEQDYYDNSGLTEAEILIKQVVKYAAATSARAQIKLKIAGLSGGALAPITAPQLAAFEAYWRRIKPAGTYITVTNSAPDLLKLSYNIYYDPLVLDADGKRLDGTEDESIQKAIQDYLTNGIGFNGRFVSAHCDDVIQKVDGVVSLNRLLTQAKYGLLPFASFVDFYLPDAGYIKLEPTNLTLNFIPSPL